MSWLGKVWGMFGDDDAKKSWGAEDGPADEVEYAHFLERFGDAAYRPDGKLKRPEDFTDFGHRQLAEQVWRSGEQPRGEFVRPLYRPGEDPEPRPIHPLYIMGQDEDYGPILLSSEGEGEEAPVSPIDPISRASVGTRGPAAGAPGAGSSMTLDKLEVSLPETASAGRAGPPITIAREPMATLQYRPAVTPQGPAEAAPLQAPEQGLLERVGNGVIGVGNASERRLRYLGTAAWRRTPHTASLNPDRPTMEWTAPGQPVYPQLWEDYVKSQGLPRYPPGGKARWDRCPNPKVAWYVWNGVHWDEAEQRVSAPSVHEQKMDFLRRVKERTPPEERYLWDLPDVIEHEHDLVRTIHAVESLGVLAESHPEYLGYYLVAREMPIEFVNRWPVDAETQKWREAVVLTRSELNDDQGELLQQLVHELQHAYDWHWNRTVNWPLHEGGFRDGPATPLEATVNQDYVLAVRSGLISEGGLPETVTRTPVPKHGRPTP